MKKNKKSVLNIIGTVLIVIILFGAVGAISSLATSKYDFNLLEAKANKITLKLADFKENEKYDLFYLNKVENADITIDFRDKSEDIDGLSFGLKTTAKKVNISFLVDTKTYAEFMFHFEFNSVKTMNADYISKYNAVINSYTIGTKYDTNNVVFFISTLNVTPEIILTESIITINSNSYSAEM